MTANVYTSITTCLYSYAPGHGDDCATHCMPSHACHYPYPRWSAHNVESRTAFQSITRRLFGRWHDHCRPP